MELKQGQATPLTIQAPDGVTSLFGRALVYNADFSSLLATVTLVHKTNGAYEGSYTPGATGFQNIIYQLFNDNVFTIPAAYDIGYDLANVHLSDIDSVSPIVAAIATLLGTPEGSTVSADILRLRKILKNRWKVAAPGVLTIYDDNGTTPLYTFNLLDINGAPTTENTKERAPV